MCALHLIALLSVACITCASPLRAADGWQTATLGIDDAASADFDFEQSTPMPFSRLSIGNRHGTYESSAAVDNIGKTGARTPHAQYADLLELGRQVNAVNIGGINSFARGLNADFQKAFDAPLAKVDDLHATPDQGDKSNIAFNWQHFFREFPLVRNDATKLGAYEVYQAKRKRTQQLLKGSKS